MASNKELIGQAVTIALALSLEIETEGLNNAQLTALVKDLKAKQKDESTDTQADTAEAKKLAAKAKAKAKQLAKVKPKPKKPPYYIMPGKAITSKRGILGPDDEVKAEYLAGGQEALDDFVETGYIGKS